VPSLPSGDGRVSGYDPKVSGPWSDTDEYPRVGIGEQDLREFDGFYAEDADKDPFAFKLARALAAVMAPWCFGEECGVGPDEIRAALTAAKLDLKEEA
jgi:hypothetical protein